ncbi:MAG: alanine racemase [Candidatus Aenigmarchaeota archaeon]|nr:alanine racemase [Candidatus Aenigmarchaeota archaeon]
MNTYQELVEEYGSPLFVVDKKKLTSQFEALSIAFNRLYPTTIAYSYKTNYLPYLCKTLDSLGACSEIISGFEFDIAKKLGIAGNKIFVNGPYKPEDELEQLLAHKCHINADNLDELATVSRIARKTNRLCDIGIRVNARIGAIPWNKFGFNLEDGEAQNAVKTIADLGNLRLAGLHMHIGTNISNPDYFHHAVQKLLDFYATISSEMPLDYIDLGGGFPSQNAAPLPFSLDEWSVPPIDAYAQAICNPLRRFFLRRKKPILILEPGRFLVDEAVSLITRVIAVKTIGGIHSVFVDAGVNILPSSYYRTHKIEVINPPDASNTLTDIYGPLCMQVDLLESGIMIPKLQVGDLIIIKTCGAYELSQSIQFIRARPAVVCVDGKQVTLIRRPETMSDITSADCWDVIA